MQRDTQFKNSYESDNKSNGRRLVQILSENTFKERKTVPQVLTCLPILTKLEDAQPPALGCVLPVCREDLCYAVQRRG